jgi:hypothetical protein
MNNKIKILIIILVIFFVVVPTIFISKTLIKESKIKKINIGTSRADIEKILGEQPYGEKYNQVTLNSDFEKLKKELEDKITNISENNIEVGFLNNEGKTTKQFTEKEYLIFQFNEKYKALINCFKKYPNTNLVTIRSYRGNPSIFFMRLEDNFNIYFNDSDKVCFIKRYGL